jgi:hypothetical protein
MNSTSTSHGHRTIGQQLNACSPQELGVVWAERTITSKHLDSPHSHINDENLLGQQALECWGEHRLA